MYKKYNHRKIILLLGIQESNLVIVIDIRGSQVSRQTDANPGCFVMHSGAAPRPNATTSLHLLLLTANTFCSRLYCHTFPTLAPKMLWKWLLMCN